MPPPFLGPLGAPLAAAYGGALVLRDRLYAGHVLRRLRLAATVVSIGNLSVGGTGKTPLVAWVAEALHREGRRVAVLSRGYGRRSKGVRVVSDGQGVRATLDEAGDEPLLLARLLPGVPVVVGEDRGEAGAHAERAFGSGVLVLDDGFQHRRLERDLDVVLLDASVDHAALRLLPAGPLREPLAALRRAAVVVLTRSERAHDEARLRALVARHAPQALVQRASTVPVALRTLAGPPLPLAELGGLRVLALSALAKPEAFESDLRRLGADVAAADRFRDHHRFTTEDLARIAAGLARNNASAVVTTAKDAVRLEPLLPLPFRTLVLEVGLVPEDAETLLAPIRRACARGEGALPREALA